MPKELSRKAKVVGGRDLLEKAFVDYSSLGEAEKQWRALTKEAQEKIALKAYEALGLDKYKGLSTDAFVAKILAEGLSELEAEPSGVFKAEGSEVAQKSFGAGRPKAAQAKEAGAEAGAVPASQASAQAATPKQQAGTAIATPVEVVTPMVGSAAAGTASATAAGEAVAKLDRNALKKYLTVGLKVSADKVTDDLVEEIASTVESTPGLKGEEIKELNDRLTKRTTKMPSTTAGQAFVGILAQKKLAGVSGGPEQTRVVPPPGGKEAGAAKPPAQPPTSVATTEIAAPPAGPPGGWVTTEIAAPPSRPSGSMVTTEIAAPPSRQIYQGVVSPPSGPTVQFQAGPGRLTPEAAEALKKSLATPPSGTSGQPPAGTSQQPPSGATGQPPAGTSGQPTGSAPQQPTAPAGAGGGVWTPLISGVIGAVIGSVVTHLISSRETAEDKRKAAAAMGAYLGSIMPRPERPLYAYGPVGTSEFSIPVIKGQLWEE